MMLNPDKNVLIFLFASIALIAFPHIYHIPLNIFGYFYLLLGWRVAGIWRPEWLPNGGLVFGLTVIGIGLVYLDHQGIFGRDSGTRLFIVALGLKLMEIKTERDLYLVTFLAFVVASSQFLYTQTLFMAAYILLVSCVLIATLVCINSRQPQPWLAVKTAATIIFQALPMAIVLFILFPRMEAPRWMLLNDRTQSRTGLSETMEPGSISELGMSTELAFRVQFSGPLPPPAQRYWRGPVLSKTDGRHWIQSPHQGFGAYMDEPGFSGTAYPYTLLMEPQNKNWVFALDMPAEFEKPLERNVNYQLITAANPDKRSEYKITSYLHYNTGYITRVEYADATQLPAAPSPEITALVTQLHGFDTPPEQFAKAVLQYFHNEDFHYTLTPPLMEDKPIEAFLFKERRGFCSHYAAAFTYLMRAAHIPARVVTGYQGGELNKVGNFLEIYQYDAHAWTEIWLQGKGWTRVDPTAAVAPERIEKNINIDALEQGAAIQFDNGSADQAPGWLKQARALWSNVDYSWQRWVINYNRTNQSKFLSGLGIGNLQTMLYWLLGLVALITVILSFALLYQKPKATDQALRQYRQFCRKLGKYGLVRQPGEGETAFAGRITAALPQSAPAAQQITALFVGLRYGKAAQPEDLQRLAEQVRAFRVLDGADKAA
jgi:transglutaminase-like putative cysteine protease